MPAIEDPVTTLGAELLALITSLEAACEFHTYDLDDLRYFANKAKLPSVGVVYNGFTAQSSQNRGRPSGLITFDVYFLIGRDRENRLHGKFQQTGPALLASVRNLILQDCVTASNGRPWEFVSEQPFNVDEAIVAYLQRWRVRASPVC